MSQYVVGKNVRIADDKYIGLLCEETMAHRLNIHGEQLLVKIGDGSKIGVANILYAGVQIGSRVIIEDQNIIGSFSKIGDDSRVCYRAYIGDDVEIGRSCIIGGFVCDGCEIGDGSRVFGSLVHDQSSPHMDWWQVNEVPPRLGSGVFIGFNATVVGGIELGDNCYVAAGAIVTCSVPSNSIVVGINKIHAIDKWKGARLGGWIEDVVGRSND